MNHALARTGILASQHLQHHRVLATRCLVERMKPQLAVLLGELVILLLISFLGLVDRELCEAGSAIFSSGNRSAQDDRPTGINRWKGYVRCHDRSCEILALLPQS